MLKREEGFTLIELLLAMALFSLMLLVVIGGFINIVRMYQAGLASRNTQQNARSGLEEMVRTARGASAAEVVPTGLCLRGDSATSIFYVQSGQLRRGLINPAAASGCDPANVQGAPTVLSSGDVRVLSLTATSIPAGSAHPDTGFSPDSVRMELRVATANPGLLAGSNCITGQGAQFCSVSNLTSTVSLRGTAQ
ncbi:prepilin-type N-terminal cleavage/methylation domain-containing protein [Candidatus Parcubacteria bacterium]|nr:prepilin-type N-terminal cleavage/methylation domain-containing protein [Candidatus Parcubacteria bacterium]